MVTAPFQQDNAPCHTAKMLQERFEEHNKEFKLLIWPLNPPVLNPIVHLWEKLAKQIQSMEAPPRNSQPTGWATLGGKSCYWTFVITCNDTFRSLWKNFGPLCCMSCPFKVLPRHLSGIQVGTLTRPPQKYYFYWTIQRWTCLCSLDHCSAA